MLSLLNLALRRDVSASTGRNLSDSDVLALVAEDLSNRSETGHRDSPASNTWISEFTKPARACALSQMSDSPSVSLGLARFGALISSIHVKKASAQLPRSAISAASAAGRLLAWPW